jgi:methyl-accepting chemotaxis protein
MGRHKRRQFFIDKEYQGRYIFNAFISIVVGSVIFALIFALFSSNTFSIVYEDYHLRLGTTPGLLLNKIFSAQWLFIILGGIAIAVAALFLSHRVAGPFFRFEKSLEEMMAGDISGRIQLRKNDEGKRLAEKINGLADMMAVSLGEIRQDAEEIRKSCNALESADGVSLEEITRIKELNEHSLKIIRKFQL